MAMHTRKRDHLQSRLRVSKVCDIFKRPQCIVDNFIFFGLWSATARATLLAASKQSRFISLVLIITCSLGHSDPDLAAEARLVAVAVHWRQTSQPICTFDRALPSCDDEFALNARPRVIAKRPLPDIAIKQRCTCMETSTPDGYEKAARVTFLFARGPRDESFFDEAQ